MKTFYLGCPEPSWLPLSPVPLFVSHGRMGRTKQLPRARMPWGLDSRGFTEISTHGQWTIPAADYARAADLYRREIGQLDIASIQDWMCEPFITARTGLSVAEHQRRTVASWLELRDLAPEVPWMPVLQGWTMGDYMDHAEMYDRACPTWRTGRVGLGSVCRRQGETRIGVLITVLAMEGLRLHGFGVKLQGLDCGTAARLESADSMAWSTAARHGRLRGDACAHARCTNCLPAALEWHAEVVERIARDDGWRAAA